MESAKHRSGDGGQKMKLTPCRAGSAGNQGLWELLLPRSLCLGSQSQKYLVLNPSLAPIGLSEPLALSEPYFSPL